MDIIRRDLKNMTSPGMKPKNWRQTEQNGVNVWPNASIWIRDELRSKVRFPCSMNILFTALIFHKIFSTTKEILLLFVDIVQ